MKKFKLVFIMLIVSFTAHSADRYIWLHGLEGEHGLNTWDIYNGMFTPDNGYVLEYKSDRSIVGIAANL